MLGFKELALKCVPDDDLNAEPNLGE